MMIALYQYFGFELPIAERFKLIKTAGFDAVGYKSTTGGPGSAVGGGALAAEEWLYKAHEAAQRLDDMRKGL